jgi:hypothetical protein
MRPTPLIVPALLLFALASLPAAAQQSDAIWVCVDDQGHKTFQNLGTGRGCHRIDGLIATIPGTSASTAGSPSPGSGPDRRGVSAASFPRVDRDTQRVRDSDRRRILEDELQGEQDRLARLRGDFNNGNPRPLGDELASSPSYRERVQRLLEDIQRSEGYIASLKRELTPQRY